MPHKNSKYKSSDIMRRDMMNVYKEVYATCWSQREAWEKTVRHKAPRFYVSPKQVYLILAPAFFRNDFSKIDKMKPTRQRMYHCLYDIIQDMSQKPTYVGMSLWKLTHYAVMQEAPEFFVDWELIRKIFRWTKKGVLNGTAKESKSERDE